MSNFQLAKHFDKAAADIKTHGKDLSNDELKKLYGLFKQATVGDNTTSEPSFYQLTEKAKWSAWKSEKGKSSDQAKHEYVEFALKFLI